MPTLTLPKGLHPAGLAWKILRYLAAQPAPVHYRILALRIGPRRAQSVLNACRTLLQTGQLRQVRPGVYGVPRQEDAPMAETPTDKALYDVVCATLIGVKFHLEGLLLAQATPPVLSDAQADALRLNVAQLGHAAEVIHAWYRARPTAPDGQKEGR